MREHELTRLHTTGDSACVPPAHRLPGREGTLPRSTPLARTASVPLAAGPGERRRLDDYGLDAAWRARCRQLHMARHTGRWAPPPR